MSEIVADALAEMIASSPDGVRVVERRPLAHQSNRLYDVWAGERHLIAKEFLKPDEFATAPVREYRALRLLAPLDVAPQPVAIAPSPRPPLGPLVVYEFMEGEMWDRRRPEADELEQLALLWLRVASVPTEGVWPSRGYGRALGTAAAGLREVFGSYAKWARAEFTPGVRAADLCQGALAGRDAVVEELCRTDPPLCFCRRDARFANVIRRPDGRLGLVDWEDSGLADPAADVADLMSHPNQEDLLSPEDWQAFLVPYLSARSDEDAGIVRRVHLYAALLPVYWLAGLLREGLRRAARGDLAGWEPNGLPANERLRRYLARALAWPEPGFTDRLSGLQDTTFFPDGAGRS